MYILVIMDGTLKVSAGGAMIPPVIDMDQSKDESVVFKPGANGSSPLCVVAFSASYGVRRHNRAFSKKWVAPA